MSSQPLTFDPTQTQVSNNCSTSPWLACLCLCLRLCHRFIDRASAIKGSTKSSWLTRTLRMARTVIHSDSQSIVRPCVTGQPLFYAFSHASTPALMQSMRLMHPCANFCLLAGGWWAPQRGNAKGQAKVHSPRAASGEFLVAQ